MAFLQKLYLLVHLLLFFLSFSSTLSSSYSATQLCSHEHAMALLQFKSSFSVNNKAASEWCEFNFNFLFYHFEFHPYGTPYPKTESWKEGTDCCSWEGVTCDNVTGHVIGLDLSGSSLQGSFPSNSSLFLIKTLQKLILSCNDFKHSKIPKEIGQLASLKHLDLSNSGFSGQVPKEISHLSQLVSLNLSRDEFSFDIFQLEEKSSLKSQLELDLTTFKSLVQNLSEVRELSLRGMNMSSVEPIYIMNLSSSLTDLDLYPCNLRGNFPNNILQFPNLKLLALGGSERLTISFPRFNLSNSLEILALENMLCLGELPDSIGDLKSLIDLTLVCHLQGSIPASIGNISQLRIAELSSNNLSGLIPSSLTNLTQLSLLHLSDNQLSGPIPSHASRFSKLSVLNLGNNLVNGTIPSWIYALPLQILYLHDNQLQGQIDQFQRQSLTMVHLGNNKLQGPIPSSIFNLVNLTLLVLSSNNLSGTVELDMFSKFQNLLFLSLSNNSLSLRTNTKVNYTLPNLKFLDLASCNLSNFPNFLKHSTELQFLVLSNNKLEGLVPEWMLNVGKNTVIHLYLSHNFLTSLPQHSWSNIGNLDLSSNMLQGVLPVPSLCTSFYSVSNNSFTGEISSKLCKAKFLEILDLSYNNLSGMIPNCLSKLSFSMLVLNLEANSFYGNIPLAFPEGCRLQNLNLRRNQINGLLPRSLVNCSLLEVLDVGNNNIEDTFPFWMESLQNLQVLVLKFNKFHGSVHPATRNPTFPKLRILDLSNNDFAGPLPVQYIENLKAMTDPHEDDNSSLYMEVENFDYQFSLVVTSKGFEIEMEKVLIILTSMDVSKNKFVGEIPKVIGNLSSLKGLNLSHNSLKGHIPQSLGNLTNLEWLDLSSNELVGEIPQELVFLTSLSILNLSNNQLVGPIPQGNQFNTFENNSYEGNLGLCGLPLTKACGQNGMPQQQPGFFHEKYELWGFGWRVVVLGYGCGVIFGLLIGYLVFHSGKPKWFVSLVGGGQQNQRSRRMRKAQVRAQRRN